MVINFHLLTAQYNPKVPFKRLLELLKFLTNKSSIVQCIESKGQKSLFRRENCSLFLVFIGENNPTSFVFSYVHAVHLTVDSLCLLENP